jgi:16S rRNA (guanine966-N2)-methyltransferase
MMIWLRQLERRAQDLAATDRPDMRASAPRVARGNKARMLRIIGGSWRGRTWRFPEGETRPTPDRVRETLFNWLAPGIAGARCLDLFAGSGALGLEALSRGAARAVFVEQSAVPAKELRQTLAAWGGEQAAAAQVHLMDANGYLAGKPEPFDVVFLDPPFAAGLLGKIITRLAVGQWLAPQALIYAECPAREGLPTLPQGLSAAKSGRAGEVGYHLLRRTL